MYYHLINLNKFIGKNKMNRLTDLFPMFLTVHTSMAVSPLQNKEKKLHLHFC